MHMIFFILLIKFRCPCRTAHFSLEHILISLICGSSILVPNSTLLMAITYSSMILLLLTPSLLFCLFCDLWNAVLSHLLAQLRHKIIRWLDQSCRLRRALL